MMSLPLYCLSGPMFLLGGSLCLDPCSFWGCLCPGGSQDFLCRETPYKATVSGRAGGMYPTGMLSCGLSFATITVADPAFPHRKVTFVDSGVFQ